MTAIRNDADLRRGYEYLGILTSIDRLNGCANPAKMEMHIAEAKREIRRYVNRDNNADRRIVKDDGMDGFIAIESLPEYIHDQAEAEAFFSEYMEMQCQPSMYDCTGQAFTSWFKVFSRRGRYYAYHSVCFDV